MNVHFLFFYCHLVGFLFNHVLYYFKKSYFCAVKLLILNLVMKAEFRRRLIFLADAIFDALDRDSVHYGLLPALFSVFTYMWCKSDTLLSNNSKKKNHDNVSR